MTGQIFMRLSRRERQIMDVVYMLGSATASEIHAHLAPEISDASLRKLVRILEAKGHLGHERRGRQHVYRPTVPPDEMRSQVARHLLRTLFQGSVSEAVSALLDASEGELSDDDVQQIRRLIDEAEAEGR
jgi:BlaI family penicillinase repressor